MRAWLRCYASSHRNGLLRKGQLDIPRLSQILVSGGHWWPAQQSRKLNVRAARNDPCPCGSGKKYKKCCDRKFEAAVAPSGAVKAQELTATEMSQLVALFDARRYVELEDHTRRLLDHCPDSGFVWKTLGVSLQLQGKEGLHALQKAAQLLPADATSHINLGKTLQALGRHEEAVMSFRRALDIEPDFAEVHCNLASALHALGQLDQAVASFHRALNIKPDYAEAHDHLGNILRELGCLNDSVASYRRALACRPGYIEAHNNLGNALRDLGQLDEAVASYSRALEIAPNFAEAHNNLGNVLRDLGRLGGAVTSYQRALAIRSDFVQAHNGLGNTLIELGRLADAVACYRHALAIRPHDAGINHNLGAALERMGFVDGALEYFQKAHEMGSIGDRVLAALILPPIMGTQQEISRSRSQFEQNVNELIKNPIQIDDPLTQVGRTNFFLAYHGLNDRDLQVKIALFFEKSCPSLLYEAPHCALPRPAAKSKIRVGFFSKFVHLHSVSRCYSGIVEALARSESYEVVLISSAHTDASHFVDGYPNFTGERVHLSFNLAAARASVSELKLDALCYLDIGMEPFSYFMAFARLARVQCVLGGHPVTTGITNMDYFLSIDAMELEGANEHYSEKLVRCTSGMHYFERPDLPTTFKTRSELGFPVGPHIYMCPMKLQKLHPDFDAALQRILELDANGVVVLFQDHQLASWQAMLARRFEKTVSADVRDRILFLPWIVDPKDFISANLVADVVLDPFHFGIGTTLITTFAVGTPIMTRPGEFLRGRVGLGFCKTLDLPECVADDTETYARQAVEIATNPVLRQRLQARILENGHLIYQNRQPIEELKGFLEGAVWANS